MTHISNLITDLKKALPFASEAAANTFLSGYSVDDQCAVISSMYIGRDHIHDQEIRDDYIPEEYKLDRFFVTGDSARWLIKPEDFGRILYEKGLNVDAYIAAFERCTANSSIDLSSF